MPGGETEARRRLGRLAARPPGRLPGGPRRSGRRRHLEAQPLPALRLHLAAHRPRPRTLASRRRGLHPPALLAGLPQAGSRGPPGPAATRLPAPWRPLALPPDATERPGSEGLTGYPIVDAGMRQLAREGFMHNRARLIVGSFLTKLLYMDWRFGAAHFARLLLDADVANNVGNWQWVAGTGNDTRPNRVLNPMRQAQRFDPAGRLHPPLRPRARVARGSPRPTRPGGSRLERRRELDYPAPILDHEIAARELRARREASERHGMSREIPIRGETIRLGQLLEAGRRRRQRQRGQDAARRRSRTGQRRARDPPRPPAAAGRPGAAGRPRPARDRRRTPDPSQTSKASS